MDINKVVKNSMMNNTGKKHGGRKKGVPNKMTSEVRAIISDIIFKEADNIPEYLASVTKPEVKLKLIIDLLPYVIPKQSDKNDFELNGRELNLTPVYIERSVDNLGKEYLNHLKKD